MQELETPIINMNYIEFVNNDSDNEEEEIFEVEADPPGAYLHISSVSTNIDMSSDEEDAYEMTFDESEAPSPSSKDVHDSFFDEFKAIQSDEEEDILGSGPINDDNSNDASTTNKEQDKTGNLEVEVIETEEPLFSDTEISRVDLNVSELLPQDDGEDRLNHSQLTDDLDESIGEFIFLTKRITTNFWIFNTTWLATWLYISWHLFPLVMIFFLRHF